MPRVISSAAVRSSVLETFPRSMTTAARVSTEMCRAFVRLSVVRASFVLVVIQESFMAWPAPSPLGLAASSAFAVFFTSGVVGDC